MLQGLSHGCVSLQETDHAPTVPHLVQVSCALSMYTLAPAFYQVLSTRQFEHGPASPHTAPAGDPGCLHPCSAILRFLEVNKFPVTWCIA